MRERRGSILRESISREREFDIREKEGGEREHIKRETKRAHILREREHNKR
jgi:hypothetical protein